MYREKFGHPYGVMCRMLADRPDHEVTIEYLEEGDVSLALAKKRIHSLNHEALDDNRAWPCYSKETI